MPFGVSQEGDLVTINVSAARRGEKFWINNGEGQPLLVLTCYSKSRRFGRSFMLTKPRRLPLPLRQGRHLSLVELLRYRLHSAKVLAETDLIAVEGTKANRHTLFTDLEIVDIPFGLKIVFTPPGSEQLFLWQSALA